MKSKEECIQMLRDFNNSNLSINQWCLENDLNRTTFTKYRKLYNEEALVREGVLNWASVDLDLEPDNHEPDEDESIEITVKLITFKLKKSTFKDDLAIVLKEVSRI